VVINGNLNNNIVTATGTANTLQGESGAQFDGSTLALGKDSAAPNLTLNDSAGGTQDPFIRFIPSTVANTVAMGIDNTNQAFTISYGTSAVLGTNNRLAILTNGNIQITNSLTTTNGSLHCIGNSTTLGYSTGAGGTVTQLTNKTTGVTLSRPTGQITMAAGAIASATTVTFVLTNTLISATDIIVLQHTSVGTNGAYNLNAFPAAGSATISVRNTTTGSLNEQIVLSFAIIEAVTS
jgi:hypothetical protein